MACPGPPKSIAPNSLSPVVMVVPVAVGGLGVDGPRVVSAADSDVVGAGAAADVSGVPAPVPPHAASSIVATSTSTAATGRAWRGGAVMEPRIGRMVRCGHRGGASVGDQWRDRPGRLARGTAEHRHVTGE